jgi:hypothetical protein
MWKLAQDSNQPTTLICAICFLPWARTFFYRKRLRPGAVPKLEWHADPPRLEKYDQEPQMPTLTHFMQDPTFEEQRIEEARRRRHEERHELKIRRQQAQFKSSELLKVARRRTLQKKLKRKTVTAELKLEAVQAILKRIEASAKISELMIGRLNKVLTDKGQELLASSPRRKSGAYSDKIRQFAAQIHFCSPRAYYQLRRFFCLPAASTIRSWNKLSCQAGVTSLLY